MFIERRCDRQCVCMCLKERCIYKNRGEVIFIIRKINNAVCTK